MLAFHSYRVRLTFKKAEQGEGRYAIFNQLVPREDQQVRCNLHIQVVFENKIFSST